MGQLQAALNRAWDVAPDPEQGGLWSFVSKRILSFGMILVVAFLLLVSFVLTSALSMLGHYIGALLPGGYWQTIFMGLNFLVSFAVYTLLFAAIFKVMPDADIAWRDVWVGALFTAALFAVGKLLIGLYLGIAEVGTAYGAAGSLVLILMWVYYSSLILLAGAEFTQVWARRHGKQIQPSEGAVRTSRETRQVRTDSAEPGDGSPHPPAPRSDAPRHRT